VADAAAGAGDDHALTALQTAVVEERLPRAEAGEGIAALWIWSSVFGFDHDRRHDRVLGGAAVPVEGRQREHLVVYARPFAPGPRAATVRISAPPGPGVGSSICAISSRSGAGHMMLALKYRQEPHVRLS